MVLFMNAVWAEKDSNWLLIGQTKHWIAHMIKKNQLMATTWKIKVNLFVFCFMYRLVNKQFAIENGHRNSGFSHEEWVDFP